MKTVLIVDISGKVLNYDYALCTTLQEENSSKVVLAAHLHDKSKYSGNRIKLLSLVPTAYQKDSGKGKRLLKAIEGLLNYIIIIFYVLLKQPAIIHFQWFPFMEFSSIEVPIVKTIRFLSRNIRIILTIHNVFPHDKNEIQRSKYKQRFMKMDTIMDHYIVHTESTACEVQNIYGIKKERLSIVPHGIFKPDYQLKNSSKPSEAKKTIIFYGVNRRNKGGDILIDAIKQLPENYLKRVKVLMAGKTNNSYLKELQEKSQGIDIVFKPTFIPDQDLYQMIDNADFIALPYREISQSGVLLLSLYFCKPLLISNLPSFRETLKGFTTEMFFETGNATSMRDLIVRMLNGNIDIKRELQIIEDLNSEYSWKNSATKTISIYNLLTH